MEKMKNKLLEHKNLLNWINFWDEELFGISLIQDYKLLVYEFSSIVILSSIFGHGSKDPVLTELAVNEQ